MFTAAVLTQVSRIRLLHEADKAIQIPGDWECVCHHMTIHMGRANELDRIGDHVTLFADAVGSIDGRVIAAKISSGGFCDTTNATPHVTIAVNRAVGAKPMESNKIKNWQTIGNVMLLAVIEECP